MSALGSKLRAGAGHVMFWCPGCKCAHPIPVGAGPGPRWTFNGSGDAPTLQPSVLVRTGHHVPDFAQRFPEGVTPSCWCTWNADNPGDPDPFACTVCHSYVTAGRIQFLEDCTHALAGQTVPLPDYPDHADEA